MDRRRRVALGLLLAVCAGALIVVLVGMSQARSLSGDEWARVGYGLGFLALISASLFARGLQLGQTLRYALMWIAIVAALVVGYAAWTRLTERDGDLGPPRLEPVEDSIAPQQVV